MKRIYLDNNATTGLDPRVLETILPWLSPTPANPSSLHYFGQEAKKALSKARDQVSSALHVKPSEIVFTSGGTESMNLLLRGFHAVHPQGHMITSNVEHACVTKTLLDLQKKGARITFLPAGLQGAIQPEQLQQALLPETKLICLMSVNNVTGVKTDIAAIAKLAQEREIPLIDTVSHIGKELFSISPGISALTFSGHKFHAPLGTGGVFIRSNFRIDPLITGGEQEFLKRGGTQNLPGIVGLGKAFELLSSELPTAQQRMERLRDLLIARLRDKMGNLEVLGQGPLICNTVQIAFPQIEGETLLMQLDLAGVAVSHGSACSSGGLEPSHVLINMGIPTSVARASLRFSLSRFTTEEEILRAVDILHSFLK